MGAHMEQRVQLTYWCALVGVGLGAHMEQRIELTYWCALVGVGLWVPIWSSRFS